MYKEAKRYLITAALPYANGPLHIGHLSGAYLPADIFVRYLRLRGKEVVFICGSDEHGAAITIQAKRENVSPQDIVDKYHKILKSSFEGMSVDFDIYHRTSSELHHETAAAYFKEMYDKGIFEEKATEQYYDETYDQFLADRYIKGTCPKCSNPEAYGDQCENCGSTLSPTELIDPKSTLSGSTLVKKTTKHWFLPLDKDEEWLKEWINNGKLNGSDHHDVKLWKKNVLGQCNSWLNDGLKPRAITRDLEWGVKVPLEDAEGKVLYVWLDAPIGYISATKQWAKDHNKNWEDYWKDDNSHLIHFIGKDNIVFHTIIFPSILNSVGDYNLPVNVPGNEFMNLEGDKISTSKGWSIKLDEYLQEFPDKVDELRYVLSANMPETKDSEFTWKDFQSRINNELVATYGNFVNRVFVLIHKYFDGKIPEFDASLTINAGAEQNTPSNFDQEMADLASRTLQYFDLIKKFKFRDALSKLIEIASFGNSLMQFNEPWKKIKEDEENVKTVLNACIRIVGILAHISDPYIPNSSKKLKKWIQLDHFDLSDKIDRDNSLLIDNINNMFSKGAEISKPELLFTKIEDQLVDKKLEAFEIIKEKRAKDAIKSAPFKKNIRFDEFSKLDLRIGTILAINKVPKANKLLKIEVDLGIEVRTIVSGIADQFKESDLVGKQVMVLVNLESKKIRNVESNGMILLADDKGKLVFVSPENQTTNGSEIK